MDNDLPFIQTACICESVLQENDGLVSLVRLLDTARPKWDGTGPPPAELRGQVPIKVVVGLKSGAIKGESQVRLQVRRPDGKSADVGPWEILLNGGVHGARLIVDLWIEIGEYGLYWIDVLWNDHRLTSIPFKLEQDPQTTRDATQPAE